MANTKIITIQEVKEKINEFSEFNNSRGAYEYYKKLKNFLDKSNLKEDNPEIYGDYYKYFIRLKFLALEFFEDWAEVENLLGKHFEKVFGIKYYDLWNKTKLKLLTIPQLDERSKIKKRLKKILLECNRVIINKDKYEKFKNFPLSVAEWLKDYNANLGIGEVDSLKRIKYLTDSENIKKLDKEDKDKLIILFNLYENLKFPSDTPRGYEEDIPMVINGKYFIFTNGQAEEIKPKVIDLIKSIKVDFGEAEEKDERLREMLNRYPMGSLERRAIEEEIRKLEGRSKK